MRRLIQLAVFAVLLAFGATALAKSKMDQLQSNQYAWAGAIRWGLKRSLSLSPACGVSCRARAERAALRTQRVRFAPGRLFDAVPLVPPLRCGWAASDSAGHLGGGSITT